MHAICRLAAVSPAETVLHANTTRRSDGFKTVHFFVGSASLASPRASAAQDGQDALVAQVFARRRGGFFVDLAANDATRMSNTFALERDLGWDGVCVEANPVHFWRLAQRRCAVVAAVVADEADAEVQFAMPAQASGLAGVVADATHRVRNGHRAGSLPERTAVASYRTVPLGDVLARLIRCGGHFDDCDPTWQRWA